MKFLSLSFGILLVLTGAALIIFGGTVWPQSNQTSTHASFNAGDIRELDLNIAGGRLSINHADTDQITVEIAENLPNQYEVKSENGTLYIKEHIPRQISLFNFSVKDTAITLTLPENFEPNLKLRLSSGSVDFDSLRAKDTQINVASGMVKGDLLHADNLRINISSGKIDCAETTARTISVDCASGHVSLRRMTGDLSVSFSSGQGEFQYELLPDNIYMQLSSGMVDLQLPEKSSIALTTSSTSGKIENSVRTDPQADCSVSARVSSGNIRISEWR